MNILVLDDEKEIADLVEVYLKNENYNVFKFYDSKEAIKCIENQKLDFAILDVMIKDVDGFEICKMIRDKGLNFPVIMLTAKIEDKDKIQGLTLGADDYITKPFNPLELIARVKSAYRRYTKYNEKNEENIIFCEKINKAISEHVEVVIGPIPFSSNGININAPFSYKEISIRELMHVLNAKILIAGSITPDVYDMANDEYIEIIDVMKREELAVLNTISTAEGTIEIAIANTNKIIHGSNVLILGFGRIGKVLARKMTGLSAKVTCAARKDEDLAWIKAYGHMATNINFLGENLSQYDIIINTVPHLILTEERMEYVKKECLLIDLASNPGGIDKKTAKDRNLKLIWALALPGKVAPVTTAEFIKDTIYNILKEIYKK